MIIVDDGSTDSSVDIIKGKIINEYEGSVHNANI